MKHDYAKQVPFVTARLTVCSRKVAPFSFIARTLLNAGGSGLGTTSNATKK